MKKIKSTKGITLVALVITIIILLILVGITINKVLGENGIIEQAKWSKFLTEYRTVEEGQRIYEYSNMASKIKEKGKIAEVGGTTVVNSEEETKDEYYAIDKENGKVEIKDIEETLKETIKEIENINELTEENVELYKVSMNLINLDIKNEYVINIKTGKLYKLKGDKIFKKIWHIPEYGVGKGNEGNEGDGEDKGNEGENKGELIITPRNIQMEEGETKEIKVRLGEQEIETRDIKWKNEEEDEEYQDDEEVPDIDDIDEYEEREEGEERIEIEENDYEDDIISIKDGKVIGEVVGSTKVKVTYKKDGKEYNAELNVEVTGEEAEIIGIKGQVDETGEVKEPEKIEVNRGKKKTVRVYNAYGKRISNKKFNWTIEDETIAKVSKKGIVTGVSGTKNEGKVIVTGTLKTDSSVIVKYEINVLELTSFKPQLEIVGKNLVITNNIDRKYGITRYRYIFEGTQVAKRKSKKHTVKNKIEANKTYTVEVIASNGKYQVSSGPVTITSPSYYAGYEIANLSPYGYDMYIYGVKSEINSIINTTNTEKNGTDDSKAITATKIETGLYYIRINVDEHNSESGTYISKLDLRNSSNKILETTSNIKVTVPVKNTTVTTIEAESIVKGVRDNDIRSGYCNMTANGKTYNLEVINIEDFATYEKETDTYKIRDMRVGTYNVSRTAVIKCKKNLQIDGTVTTAIGTISGSADLTKVKGMFICVNETLTNNKEITMTARGTCNTEGESIYLWKNSNGNYEYVPQYGANGGAAVSTVTKKTYKEGIAGYDGTNRQTGGGGSGGVAKPSTSGSSYTIYSGSGSYGTSYSGGSGGGGCYVRESSSSTDRAGHAEKNGGSGGHGNSNKGAGNNGNYSAGGGAGNPGGYGEYNQHTTTYSRPGAGETGTGGLLIIYADTINNKGSILSEGKEGGYFTGYETTVTGGSSGGGSINIFYNSSITEKTISAKGGNKVAGYMVRAGTTIVRPLYSGKGGNGTVTIGNISTGTFVKDN